MCGKCVFQKMKADPARYIASKLAGALREKGVPRPYPGKDFVRRVIEQSEFAGDPEALSLCRIVAKDEDKPLTLENAILVKRSKKISPPTKKAK